MANDDQMAVWTEAKIGLDGREYELRYLLTPNEVRGLRCAGLLPEALLRVHGMQQAGDTSIAQLERAMRHPAEKGLH
jgi:hypothetical protein